MNSVPGKVLDAISSGSTSLKRTLSAKAPPFRAIFDQSFAKLLQFQLNFAFNDSSSTFSSSSPSSPIVNDSVNIPNEYRNLLLSLSNGRCDHILWIRSLRKLNWRGDGDFSFTLDKCGVPTLKSGEYKLNLCYECLDAPLEDDETEGARFLWKGNLVGNDDGGGGDDDTHAELPMRSILPMVQKCAQMMRKNGQTMKGGTILVYMPCIMQLFISIFAATRIGAILVYVNASINKDPEGLAQILMLSGAQLILTIDGFYIDGKLERTKEIMDAAIGLAEKKQQIQNALKVIVVRHMLINANNGCPLREGGGNMMGAEIPMEAGRDYFWSDLMVEEMGEGEEELAEKNGGDIEWMESEDIIFHAIHKIKNLPDGTKWHFESYTVGQIALLIQLLASKMTKSADVSESAQIIAARQKELLKKRQSLHLIERKSFDEKDEENDGGEEEEGVLATRKGSTRSQPGFSRGPSKMGTPPKEEEGEEDSKQQHRRQTIWPMVEANDVLFLASLFAISKTRSSLFLSETSQSQNDQVHIFGQIQAHKITQLLIAQRYIKILSRTLDSLNIWSGEEEKMMVHFKVPSLRVIFTVAKATSSQNRDQVIEENEAILKQYIGEKGEEEEEEVTKFFHIFY